MFFVPQHLLADFSTVLATETPLTDEQKNLLKEEITNDPTNRGYQNMRVEDICVCLANPFNIQNTEQPELVAKDSILKGDLYNYLAKSWAEDGIPYWYKIESAAKRSDGLGIACAMIVSAISHLDTITLGAEQVNQYEQILVQSKIISQDAADAILKQPANWQEWVPQPPRLESLGFGVGCVLSTNELREVV